MKFSIIYRIIGLILLLTMIAFAFSCKPNETQQTNSNGATAKAPKEKVDVGNAQTPMDAYKMLFKAVKAEDSESIRKMMSPNSIKFAEAAAGRGNKSIDDVLKNGFYASTMTETLPDMRDERMKDEFGALEVWVSKEQRWEDVAFVKETDGWKIAAGDQFSGTYKSPGMPQTTKEKIAANAVANNLIPIGNINANVNTSASTDPIPKKDTFKNRAK
jgi:hypothetical protein